MAYDLGSACREIDRLTGQVKMLKSVSEAYTAADRSADDVYHIALQDMSTQLQAAASDRAAGQTAIIKLQECALACVCQPWLPMQQQRNSLTHSVLSNSLSLFALLSTRLWRNLGLQIAAKALHAQSVVVDALHSLDMPVRFVQADEESREGPCSRAR